MGQNYKSAHINIKWVGIAKIVNMPENIYTQLTIRHMTMEMINWRRTIQIGHFPHSATFKKKL